MYAGKTYFEIPKKCFSRKRERRRLPSGKKGNRMGSLSLGCSGNRESKGKHSTSQSILYFLRKDLQSVHWSTVGLDSWVPTRILSRVQ